MSSSANVSRSVVEPVREGGARVHEPATTALTPVLGLRDISKSWPKATVPVLDGVTLALEPGTTALVRGSNGVGKTTLLRIAAGMLRPDRGGVSVQGLDPQSDRRRYQRRIGFLSAGNSGVYARLTVRLQLDYWSRIAFVAAAARRPAVDRTLQRFGLGELASRRCDRLSLGQRQRLRLAMTFLHDPALVLLDEPANSLDDDGKALLREAVEDLAARGGAAVWCAPSAEGVGLPFDVAYAIESGRLVRA